MECLDRIYLNGYVPNLQVGGQVVTFLTDHLGFPMPSPALFNRIGDRFRRAVSPLRRVHRAHPMVRFDKDVRKADVMRPYLDGRRDRPEAEVVAIGVAQEFQRVFTGYERPTRPGVAQFGFDKADRRVSRLLLLPVGLRVRSRLHQGRHLLPLPDEDLGQRP